MKVRIVKVGGSLLESPRLRERILKWIAAEPVSRSLFVVGGGPPVDAIRNLASVHDYEEHFLHWLCVDLMRVTHRLFAAQLPEWPQITSKSQLQHFIDQCVAQQNPSAAIVDVTAYYTRELEPELPLRLPWSWETTSDSLAALLAHVVAADELVLLKSCPLDNSRSLSMDGWQQLARQGVVDQAFPQSIVGLKNVRCIMLPD